MLLQVESVQLSKSGKSYWVKASNGKGYTSRAMGIEQTATRSIDAVVGSVRLGNDDVPTITSFEFVEAPAAAPGPSGGPPRLTDSALRGALMPSSDRYWLPFVSNQTAHLIAAGLIKTPEDLERWVKASYQAISAADDVKW